MSEQAVPEDVYRDAAEAAARTNTEPPHTFDAWAAMGKASGASPAFKAAVEIAYRAGQNRGSDIVEVAIAYVTEPEGSDQVEHYWYQLKDAVATYLKHADG